MTTLDLILRLTEIKAKAETLAECHEKDRFTMNPIDAFAEHVVGPLADIIDDLSKRDDDEAIDELQRRAAEYVPFGDEKEFAHLNNLLRRSI